MSRRLLKDVAPTQLLIYSSNNFLPHKKNVNKYIYINIYILFSHQEGDERCMFISHQRNNISFNLLSSESPCYERCLTPAFASCRRRQWPEILQYRIFWTTFVVYHPNYYFSSQLSHVERKSVACKLKAATSWLHKKKYFNWGILYDVQAGKVTKQEQS